MSSLKFENPALGRSYVSSYDAGSSAFPIIEIHYDPNLANYSVPKPYTPHPNALKHPNHVFIQAEPYAGDQRTKHTYMILPGPWSTESGVDKESGMVITQKKRHNRTSAINVQTSITVGLYSTTEANGIIDDILSWEIVNSITIASINNATWTSFGVEDYEFPALLFGYSSADAVTKSNGDVEFFQQWNMRPKTKRAANKKTIVTYSIGGVNLPSTNFGFKTANLIYNGIFLNIRFFDVLNDAFSIYCQAGTGNPTWPNGAGDSFSAAATSPSATAYNALVIAKTPVPIGFSSNPWKIAGIYRNETHYIIPQ